MPRQSLEDVKDKLYSWRREYNHERTYSLLKDMIIDAFARSLRKDEDLCFTSALILYRNQN